MELEQLIWRVRSEFTEMPDLCLTLPQAMRLWGVDSEQCDRIVNELVRVAFLARTSRGEVVRAS